MKEALRHLNRDPPDAAVEQPGSGGYLRTACREIAADQDLPAVTGVATKKAAATPKMWARM